MKKILPLLLLVFFIFTPYAQAKDKEFDITTDSSYVINDTGETLVTQKIQIKNKTEFTYTPSYTLTIGFDDLKNIRVFDRDGAIPFVIEKVADGTKIEIEFTKRIVGVDKVNAFTVSFDTQKVAQKEGSIWEVNIPGLSNPQEFTSYTVNVSVPQSFGQASIIKPFKQNSYESSLTFSKNEIGQSGVNILYGSEQYYKYNLSYHLQNSNLFPITTEIALPPSTPNQEVLINSLSPKPSYVYTDIDGNWLAVYSLSSHQKIQVQAQGYVKIMKTSRNTLLSDSDKYTYIKQASYWEVNDPKIKNIASTLGTPSQIYNYVVKSLTYDYSKIANDTKRLGAAAALTNPTNAVCLEFTDLFVTLARASSIPARSVEGYAYTRDTKLHPRSLVKDILHAWAEYYDDAQKKWVMVDPTWGNTTKGNDYFNTLDFNHITFVMKGKESTYPIPAGGYKNDPNTQDVSISFSDKGHFITREQFILEPRFPTFSISGFPIVGSVKVINTGNSEIRNKKLFVDSTINNQRFEFYIEKLPPFSSKSFSLTFAKTPLLTNKEFNIRMLFGGTIYQKNIKISILPERIFFIVLGGIICAITISISLIAIKIRGIFISRQKG